MLWNNPEGTCWRPCNKHLVESITLVGMIAGWRAAVLQLRLPRAQWPMPLGIGPQWVPYPMQP